MKSLSPLFIILLIGISTISFAQVKFEAQLGGSNFLGLTLNTAYDIPLEKTGNHHLVPSLGVGILAPGWDVPTVIIHAGLNYKFKNWGIGGEVSGFTPNPFWGNTDSYDFVSMIVYPNINYTFNFKSGWYLALSGGALIPFEKQSEYNDPQGNMIYAGDAIPGIGIIFGHRSNCKF